MPASVEDRMRKLGFPDKKPPATIPDEESKPAMAKKPKVHVLEEKPSLKGASKSRKPSSKKRGSK